MEPIGLKHIEIIFFPSELANDIYKKLQISGAKGFEFLALCAGNKNGKEFYITDILYPKQYLQKSAFGLSFHVEGEELERIGDWLYKNQKSLIAQVHSHPAEAYHSEADDNNAIITKVGGFSIVVPNFGNSDINFEGSAIYRLFPDSGWTKISKHQAQSILNFFD